MTLAAMRDEMGAIDKEIIRLISRRQQIAGKIARLKQKAGIPVHDEAQAGEVLKRAFDRAAEEKIDPVSVRNIFSILVTMSEERQRECLGNGNLP
ncbi:MAG: chorismate mutase [Methanoregulaceae archaeon]